MIATTDQRLLNLKTQWVGKHVVIWNDRSRSIGKVTAIKLGGRKLQRIGYPYAFELDGFVDVPWHPETTEVEEVSRNC